MDDSEEQPLMTVTCKLTVDDLVHASEAQYVKAKGIITACVFKNIAVMGVGGWLAYTWWEEGFVRQAEIACLAMLGILTFNVLYALQARSRFLRSLRSFYDSCDNSALEHPVTYKLYTTYFEHGSSVEMTRSCWSVFSTISETEQYILLAKKEAGMFVYVPKRAFGHSSERQEFISIMRSHVMDTGPAGPGSRAVDSPNSESGQSSTI